MRAGFVGLGVMDPRLGLDADLAALDAESHLERWRPVTPDPSAHHGGGDADRVSEIVLRPLELLEPGTETSVGAHGLIGHSLLMDRSAKRVNC